MHSNKSDFYDFMSFGYFRSKLLECLITKKSMYNQNSIDLTSMKATNSCFSFKIDFGTLIA